MVVILLWAVDCGFFCAAVGGLVIGLVVLFDFILLGVDVVKI